jgi:hypothetical protein
MITKRQMGLGFAAVGLIALLAILAVDLLKAGNYEGIGPMQRMALIAAGLLFLTGLSLIPFGNRPA